VNEITDPETGTVYSVKKFKILMKLFEDYGWEPTNYVSEIKKPVAEMPADQGAGAAMAPGDAPAVDAPTDIVREQGLPGNELGAELGAAMKQ
jgi:hypothetical protein